MQFSVNSHANGGAVKTNIRWPLDPHCRSSYGHVMKSPGPQGYYAVSAGSPPSRARLTGTRDADLCIIGAGYTGLTAALQAAQAGMRVLVLESRAVGFGASGRNGGQIHTGLRRDQAALETWLGAQHARDLWTLAEEAKSLIRAIVSAHQIACNLKDGLIIAAHNRKALKELEEDAAHLSRNYGYPHLHLLNARETAAQIGSETYVGARFDAGGGHLHPLRFARGLAAAAEAAGALINENSRVVQIEAERSRVRVRTDQGEVIADQAILAADAWNGTLAHELEPYIGHLESFVTATVPLATELFDKIIPGDAAVADTRHVLDYYRKSQDRRLLFAGREAYFRMPSDIAGLVRPRMLTVFPQLAGVPTEYAWSGTVGITVTRMPHFGRLSERILFAHGYSGQGVALATLGGKLLAEAALGNSERFGVLARVPARPFPGGRLFRRPLIAAALFAFKVVDAI